MEGYNACEDADSNMRAMALAKNMTCPAFGGSDPQGRLRRFWLHNSAGRHYFRDRVVNYIRAGKPTMIGGQHYLHTTKAKLGKVNNVLVYSFWLYNKFLALFRRKARNFELMENQILDSIRAGKRKDPRYIPLRDE